MKGFSIGAVLATFVLFFAAQISSASVPKATEYKTIGNPDAPKGGTLYRSFRSEPERLNPINSTDLYAQWIHSYTMSGLMEMNLDTYEWEPGLAERFEVSKDGMSYTFFLNKNAKFHDGKPVTAEDVKFSFDSVKDPAFEAATRVPYYENFKSIEVIDPHTVKINLVKKYFGNFNVMVSVGYTAIVPKHFYGDAKKKNNKNLMGSGPYKLEKYDQGKSIVLARNEDWYGAAYSHSKGKYNFDKIFIRFVKEENLQIEMLKKGQIDFAELTPEAYKLKTKDAPFGTSVLKKEVQNKEPKGISFVGWNLKNPLFKDRDVRVALAHLMNRQLINEKFKFNMDALATGPWYIQSPIADPSVKPLAFDIAKAKELLKKAGWSDSNKDGILDKKIEGKQSDFKFTLLLSNRDVEKYFTIYKEDLKKAGIEMNIRLMEWNSFVKALDDQTFEAVTLAWGGGSVESDPKQIWHSESARSGGSNFISYNNPKVDKLIDQAREEMDTPKRRKMFQQVYRMIAEDAPYLFMFVPKTALYAHTAKVGMSKPTMGYYIGHQYWWMTK